MQCTGTVLEKRGDKVLVLIEAKACDHCHACGIGSGRGEGPLEVEALNEIGAEKDDRVRLQLSGKRVVSASAVLFLVPFCGFMAGFFAGYYILWHFFPDGYRTLVSLAPAFIFLGASYYLVHLLGKRFEDVEFVITGLSTGEEPKSPFERPVD